MILIAVLFFIIIIPIWIAIKFPTVRMAMGIVQIVVGLLFITTLWWLLGLGLFLGVPLLFLGIIFLITGMTSKKRQLLNEQRSMSSSTHDPMEQLKKLKVLLDAGAISQEEYQEKKKKFLDGV